MSYGVDLNLPKVVLRVTFQACDETHAA